MYYQHVACSAESFDYTSLRRIWVGDIIPPPPKVPALPILSHPHPPFSVDIQPIIFPRHPYPASKNYSSQEEKLREDRYLCEVFGSKKNFIDTFYLTGKRDQIKR